MDTITEIREEIWDLESRIIANDFEIERLNALIAQHEMELP